MSEDLFCKLSAPEESAFLALWDAVQRKNPFPLFGFVEITHRCNLSCPHCYLPSASPGTELTLTELTTVFDQLVEMGVLVLTLSGGEPTCRTDFYEILEAAVERRFVVILKTNALSLDASSVKRLADIGVYELNVSLYHTSPALHDRFVGREGAWQAAVTALRTFHSLGRKTKVALIGMDWNVENVPLLEDLCRKEGWRYAVDYRIEPRSDGDRRPMELQCSPAKLVDLMQQSTLLSGFLNGQQKERDVGSRICGMGRSSIVLQSDGDVLPCVSLSQIVLGNVRQQSLSDIWLNSPTRREISALKWDDQPRCRDCDLRSDCPRCPSTGFNEHGDLLLPSDLDCELAGVWRAARLAAKNDRG